MGTRKKAGTKGSLKISKMTNILLLISIALFAGLGYSVPHGYYKKGYKYYVPRVRYYTPMMKTRAMAAGNIVEELTRNGASTLIDLAVKAGLADTLTGDGPFTVFAPTNAAFAKLPADLVTAVTSDTDLLKTVLLYHVVPGKITSDKVTNGAVVSTVEGSSVTASVTSKHYYGGGKTIKINDSKVVKADVMATNGVIHFIDSVLLSPTASA